MLIMSKSACLTCTHLGLWLGRPSLQTVVGIGSLFRVIYLAILVGLWALSSRIGAQFDKENESYLLALKLAQQVTCNKVI